MVFKKPFYIILGLGLTFGLLAVYYTLLYKVTTFEVFLSSNGAVYNWLSLGMTIGISLLFGIAISFLVWQWQERKENNAGHAGNTILASFLGAISIGCPVCGAFLGSILGISGGLMAFPFQGLEIKAISIGLLGWAVSTSAKSIATKVCPPLVALRPVLFGIIILLLVISLPVITGKLNLGFLFQPGMQQASISTVSHSHLPSINPEEGFSLNIIYGDMGPKLIAAGAIDLEKMKLLYERGGSPLTDEQIKILTEGSNKKIKIAPENSHFLLNLLWAFGLANKNIILDEGPMMKYGEDQIGNFASTGGWTLGTKDAIDLYSKFEIIKLNTEQQAILEDFANNSYRPCCSNPVSFPDCNHGMAALALGELMASQGALVDEIFEAYKYFNAFWFPQTYFDVAKYFKAKYNKDWNEIDGRLVAGKDYSTPQGWQKVRQWLSQNNLLEEVEGGGGCGV